MQTILRIPVNTDEHPNLILVQEHMGSYRVRNSFWDGTKYQSHSVGARYGYKHESRARKVCEAYALKMQR